MNDISITTNNNQCEPAMDCAPFEKTGIAKKTIPAAALIMSTLFIIAMTCMLRNNAHFFRDDIYHFTDARTKTFWQMLSTPIDVHFAPLHQLVSFIIFNIYGLNFDIALGIEVIFWLTTIGVMYPLLRRFCPHKTAIIIMLLFATNPLWIHSLVWWSSSAHRMPYMLFQAISLLTYLRYREYKKLADFLLCALSQILALGFFVKGILFPAVLVLFELCLAAQAQNKSISIKGLKLCAFMGGISLVYIGWYFKFAPVSHSFIGQKPTLIQVVFDSMIFTTKLGNLLLFLPINSFWSDWISVTFWITLFSWRIYENPVNAAPIAALLVLLLINFAIPVWGRGELFASPLTAMRYYSENLVLISAFVALSLKSRGFSQSTHNNITQKNLIFALLIVLSITYPIASYFSNKDLFQTTYRDIKLTHKFMINVQKTLKKLNAQNSPKVLETNFPSFVYAFFAGRLPLKDVFDKLYPHIEWVHANSAINGIYTITDDGHAILLESTDAPK